jgi:hypothetical protein
MAQLLLLARDAYSKSDEIAREASVDREDRADRLRSFLAAEAERSERAAREERAEQALRSEQQWRQILELADRSERARGNSEEQSRDAMLAGLVQSLEQARLSDWTWRQMVNLAERFERAHHNAQDELKDQFDRLLYTQAAQRSQQALQSDNTLHHILKLMDLTEKIEHGANVQHLTHPKHINIEVEASTRSQGGTSNLLSASRTNQTWLNLLPRLR